MKTFAYTITDETGIHARPAGELVKAAREFQSEIILESNGKKADARKIMAVMAMGVKNGQTVTVSISGADEDAAAKAMETVFKTSL